MSFHIDTASCVYAVATQVYDRLHVLLPHKPPNLPTHPCADYRVSLQVHVACDNARYECDAPPRLAFRPTMMFQARTFALRVTNTGLTRLDYAWRVETPRGDADASGGDRAALRRARFVHHAAMDCRSQDARFMQMFPASLQTALQRFRPACVLCVDLCRPPQLPLLPAGVYTLSPESGSIPAGCSQEVALRFRPVEVEDCARVLACDIADLDPSCSPLTRLVDGKVSSRPGWPRKSLRLVVPRGAKQYMNDDCGAGWAAGLPVFRILSSKVASRQLVRPLHGTCHRTCLRPGAAAVVPLRAARERLCQRRPPQPGAARPQRRHRAAGPRHQGGSAGGGAGFAWHQQSAELLTHSPQLRSPGCRATARASLAHSNCTSCSVLYFTWAALSTSPSFVPPLIHTLSSGLGV
jgi:hypothetical protein